MTSERAHAYRRVIQTLDQLGPSKLLGGEQDRIRHAADNLIFSRDLLEDEPACEALKDVERLCRALVESGRWEQAGATRLAADISQCGPPPPVELEAA
jgi:alpha-D-ribose 1-methylphosphonate 5-triphosphate synthase subunit PhnL